MAKEDKKGGFWKGVTGVFFETEAKPSAPSAEENKDVTQPGLADKVNADPKFPTRPAAVVMPIAAGGIDQEMLRVIWDSVAEDAGGAFEKYLEMMNNLGAAIPDETVRIKAALTALQTSSKIMPQDILGSINEWGQELEKEKGIFEQQVTGKQDEIAALQQRLTENTQRIEEYRKMITDLEKNNEQIVVNSQGLQSKLEEFKAKFANAYAEVQRLLAEAQNKVGNLSNGGK